MGGTGVARGKKKRNLTFQNQNSNRSQELWVIAIKQNFYARKQLFSICLFFLQYSDVFKFVVWWLQDAYCTVSTDVSMQGLFLFFFLFTCPRRLTREETNFVERAEIDVCWEDAHSFTFCLFLFFFFIKAEGWEMQLLAKYQGMIVIVVYKA